MGNLVMGERYIPGLAGWPESARRMFEANYTWASSLASDKTVLDCACGSGYGSAILAARARTVVGADVDPRMVEHARQTYADAGVRFEQFSITEIPYPDGYFDLVVSFDTIEHVRDDHRVLLELKRVTRADGAIVLSTPLANYPKEQGEPDLWDATHVREYSAYEWLHLLGQYFEAAEFFCRDAPDFGIRPSLWRRIRGAHSTSPLFVSGTRRLRSSTPTCSTPSSTSIACTCVRPSRSTSARGQSSPARPPACPAARAWAYESWGA